MRSEVVKLVSISKKGSETDEGNVDESCATAWRGGGAMGTA